MRLALGSPLLVVALGLALIAPGPAAAGEPTAAPPPTAATGAALVVPPGPAPIGPTPAVLTDAAPTGARRYAGPLVVSAITAATALSGAALVYGSAGDYAALRDHCATTRCAPSDIDALSTRVHAGYALLAVGAAALAVDLVQIVVIARTRPTAPRITIAPTVGGLVAAGSF